MNNSTITPITIIYPLIDRIVTSNIIALQECSTVVNSVTAKAWLDPVRSKVTWG